MPADLAGRLATAGQSHLLAHAERLDPTARAAFAAELAAVDWARVAAAWASRPPPLPPDLRPPEALTWRRRCNEPGLPARLARDGEALLAAGRVATLLLAGGQGTRLGYPGPKGTYVLGPDPDRSLYASAP